MVEKLNLTLESKPVDKKEEKELKKQNDKFKKIFKVDKLKNKPQKTMVLFMNETTGVAEPIIVEAKNGIFEYRGKPYHVREDCRYTMIIDKERVPLMVQRSQDLKPIGHAQWESMEEEQKFAEFQYMAVKGIQNAEIVRTEGGGSKLDTKTIIIIIIVGIVALAFLKNYI